MELVQITLLAEKQKWLQRFRKNYTGAFRRDNPSRIYRDELSRFFVAKSDDAEVGFIQLNNYSHWLKSPTQQNFWSAGMAYVKPPYRHKGVLRYMLTECIDKHHVGAAFMETERLISNSDYYRSLGFCRAHGVDDNHHYVYLIHSRYGAPYLDRMETDEAANDGTFEVSA